MEHVLRGSKFRPSQRDEELIKIPPPRIPQDEQERENTLPLARRGSFNALA